MKAFFNSREFEEFHPLNIIMPNILLVPISRPETMVTIFLTHA
uniref:Uncharacterized protein n=1 Tax=Rhizophora mucronata TaxID=61149 RepID=A0A2P2NPZ4_RHIMU